MVIKWQYDNYEQALELHRQFRKTDKYDECEKRNYVKQISNRDKWRKTHPEKCREYSKMHRNHDITEKEWKGCLSVFNNQCVYCGLPFEKHIMKRNGKDILMRLHKDHVDDEGCNDLRNAVPSCQSCNSRKHQDSLDEWYPKQKFFTAERYNKIIWWTMEGYKEYIEEKPPYRILKEKNEDNGKFHFNLWSVDEMRNIVDIIATKDKRKDLNEDIKGYLKSINL